MGSLASKSHMPVPASVEFSPDQVRMTIIRVATHPFLPRHNLRLTLGGPSGCSSEIELFHDTGYVSRGNLNQTRGGLLYVVGQFDATRRGLSLLHNHPCRVSLTRSKVISLDSFVERQQE